MMIDFESEQWELSPDLQELGDQLRRDADRLAVSYPPRPERLQRRATPTNSASRLLYWWSAGLVCVLALAMLGVWNGKPFQKSNSSMVGRTDGPVFSGMQNQGNSTAEPTAAAESSLPTGLTPVVALPDLSAPELEAVLDLWEQDPQTGDGGDNINISL